MIQYDHFFSLYTQQLKLFEKKSQFDLIGKSEYISFAGGLPDPELFPIEELSEIVKDVLRFKGKTALQYGQIGGDSSLKKELQKFMEKDGAYINHDQLLVTTSSKQGLDLIGKIIINHGDIIFAEKPTYPGAIQVFKSYSSEIYGVDLDEFGINTELLTTRLQNLINRGNKVKLIYIIPDFQNPTGITLNFERRKKIINIAEKYDLIIVEDSSYRQLRFGGEQNPSLISLNSERVVALYSFSKMLFPGFRIGWMVGPKEFIKKATIAKKSADLCSSPFNQLILSDFLRKGLIEKQIAKIIKCYKAKKEVMLKTLNKYMSDIKGVRWTHPEGGIYIWIILPEYMDIEGIHMKALKNNVIFSYGSDFNPEVSSENFLRLNFSYPSIEQIAKGIKILAEIIRNYEFREQE